MTILKITQNIFLFSQVRYRIKLKILLNITALARERNKLLEEYKIY